MRQKERFRTDRREEKRRERGKNGEVKSMREKLGGNSSIEKKEVNRGGLGKRKRVVLKSETEEKLEKRNRKRIERRSVVNKETKKAEVMEWVEEVVRVGTGYRVRRDVVTKGEKKEKWRRFDVGYTDVKKYRRKEGVDAEVSESMIGRKVKAKGHDARIKVINTVCEREKRRRVSVYTGNGILRKSEVGKKKLKPTKATRK
jgi:hypothetical protein